MTAALPLQIPATREVTTLRFGVLDVPLDDLIQFADGLPGFDTCARAPRGCRPPTCRRSPS